MSAPGRSEALIPPRAARRESLMSAPGRSAALVTERASAGVAP
jgi:hypothetical protein